MLNQLIKEIQKEELEIRLMLLRDIRSEDRVDCFKAIERYDAFLDAVAKGPICEGRSECKS